MPYKIEISVFEDPSSDDLYPKKKIVYEQTTPTLDILSFMAVVNGFNTNFKVKGIIPEEKSNAETK